MYLHINRLKPPPPHKKTQTPPKQQGSNKLAELLWQKDGEGGLLRSLPDVFWKFPGAKVYYSLTAEEKHNTLACAKCGFKEYLVSVFSHVEITIPLKQLEL